MDKMAIFFTAENYVINIVVIGGYAAGGCLQTFVNTACGHGDNVWLIDRPAGSREQPAARVFRTSNGSGCKGFEVFLQSVKARR